MKSKISPILFLVCCLFFSGCASWQTEWDKYGRKEGIYGNNNANTYVPTEQCTYTTKQGFFACYLASDLETMMDMVRAKDQEAINSMIEQHRVIYYNPGLKFYCVDSYSSKWSVVKIRFKNSTDEVYSESQIIGLFTTEEKGLH